MFCVRFCPFGTLYFQNGQKIGRTNRRPHVAGTVAQGRQMSTRRHLATFGDIWRHLATFGDIWRHLATFGDIWRHLATFGDIWRHLATFGDIWRHLATFGDICPKLVEIRFSRPYVRLAACSCIPQAHTFVQPLPSPT